MTPIDPSAAELFVEDGPELGRVYPLSPLPSQPRGLLIGRLDTCYIRFPPHARTIGREHACLEGGPQGVFLVGLHQNGTFVDGVLVGKGGRIELRYGARIQLGKEGPVLLVRERAQKEQPAPPPSATGTRYELPPAETEQDLRAELEALKAANLELDRQNQRLHSEKEELAQKLRELAGPASAPAATAPARAPAPAAPSAASSEQTALLLRFGQGLLALQKQLSDDKIDRAALRDKLELLIFDLADLHSTLGTR